MARLWAIIILELKRQSAKIHIKIQKEMVLTADFTDYHHFLQLQGPHTELIRKFDCLRQT